MSKAFDNGVVRVAMASWESDMRANRVVAGSINHGLRLYVNVWCKVRPPLFFHCCCQRVLTRVVSRPLTCISLRRDANKTSVAIS